MASELQKDQPDSADGIKFLFLAIADPGSAEIEYVPHFYAEVRIDFGDVRTGFRETVSLNRAVEIHSEDVELSWAGQNIREVDPDKVTSTVPKNARLRRPGDFVNGRFIARMENHFLQYLLRSYKARVYRNFALNVYSPAGESHDEFVDRCTELYSDMLRGELDLLHDVFNRKLEQIRQKFLISAIPRDLEQAGTAAQNKDIFSRASERIDDLFVRTGRSLKPDTGIVRHEGGMRELEERLFSLELEARQQINSLFHSFMEKARAIDEYILHPNLRDIHFVRSCILWVPVKAE